MIAFDPTDDQKLMQESVAQLARHFRARARETEKLRAIPEDMRVAAHSFGLGLAEVPTELGGAGLGHLTTALVDEELAYGDPGAGFGIAGPGSFGGAVLELGTPEQAKALLARFSEADGWQRFGAVAWGEPRASAERPGLVATATRTADGWELRGEKAYVVNADRAEVFVVFAQVDPAAGWRGTGAFVVERGAPGVRVLPRETSLGLDAASFGGVALEGVKVADDRRLLGASDYHAALVRFFAKQALRVAARAVGLARAAFDVAREYGETRRAFGKPIGHFQAVAFTLADRAMDVDAARALVWRAAHAWDTGAKESEALLATARAVSFAQEAAMRCGDDAVQLHGGAGFMRDYPVEKFMRDAKQLQLCVMTAEQSDQLAAAIELGRAIDPGDVLPSAESQSAFV
ncbi:MAG TPA: acyl-CoA dehydrogenase family protein [Polyangiaceae bacterium]|jgi:acyl-CoA dehydrogenase